MESMETVEKLRQVARNMTKGRAFREDCSLLCHIADAIEQEHAELLNKTLGEQDDAIRHANEVAYSTGYEAGFDEGLASTDCWSADDWTGQHEDAMAERGWVKLPVDADGEYIRVGDVMDTEHFGTVEVEGFVHNAVAFYN